MKFTMRDDSADGLCRSCGNAHIMKDMRGKVTMLCYTRGEHHVIRAPLVECNEYEQVGRMTEWQAEKAAWILEVKGGNVIGFRPPKPERGE